LMYTLRSSLQNPKNPKMWNPWENKLSFVPR
jgi:hypothetical protein